MRASSEKKKISEVFSYPLVTSGIWQYLLAIFIIIACSGVCLTIEDIIGYRSVSYILFLVDSVLAIFFGIGPVAVAAMLSAIIWNFFFIPPKFTMDIEKTEDVLLFGMFFIIALVNGVLTARVRKQERISRRKEEQANALYQLTKGLSGARNTEDIVQVAVQNLKLNFNIDTIILLHDGNNNLKIGKQWQEVNNPDESELTIAKMVFEKSVKAGRFTDNPFETEYTFYPMPGNTIKPGVLIARHTGTSGSIEGSFWDTCITQISNAIEREHLNELVRKARILDESDKLYKTLFNSISHELRIPVATIIGAAESFMLPEYPVEIKNELSLEILKASDRLNRLIENLLNMSRLDSGHLKLRLDWCDINDLINKVTDSLESELKPFSLKVVIDEDMPLVRIDFGLMEQVLYNLLHNATQYAAGSDELEINAKYKEGHMELKILDRGPGFPEKDLSLIFNRFFRVEGSRSGGTGLGLSIAKGFTEAHNGLIVAANRDEGGAIFIIRIPSGKPDMEIVSNKQ